MFSLTYHQCRPPAQPNITVSAVDGKVWPGDSTSVNCTNKMAELTQFQMSLQVNDETVGSAEIEGEEKHWHVFALEDFNEEKAGQYK